MGGGHALDDVGPESRPSQRGQQEIAFGCRGSQRWRPSEQLAR